MRRLLKVMSVFCLLGLALPTLASDPLVVTAPCLNGFCLPKTVCKGNGCYTPRMYLRDLIAKLEADGVEINMRGDQLDIIIGVDRFFRYRSSLLIAQHRVMTLDGIAALIRLHGYHRVIVVGHTDEVGSDRSKFARSYQQANTIAAYLWSQGILLGNIKIIGCGDTEPVASNKTVDGSAANRRIEILVR